LQPFNLIRHLNPANLALYKVIRLEALSSDPDAFGETLAVAKQRSEPEWTAWLAKVIIPELKNIIVVEREDRPVAMCGFGLSEKKNGDGFLWGMFVSPHDRRSGLASRMLAEAENWIAQKGGKTIRANVAAPNQGAIDFYRNHGFLVGELAGSLRAGSSVLVYPIEKKL